MKLKTILILLFCATGILVATLAADKYYYKNRNLKFSYPWRGILFPADYTTPTLIWNDKSKSPQTKWKISIDLQNHKNFLQKELSTDRWTPTVSEWDSIKIASSFKDIRIQLSRADNAGKYLTTRAVVTFRISEDSVNTPILYREIPLPFSLAEEGGLL